MGILAQVGVAVGTASGFTIGGMINITLQINNLLFSLSPIYIYMFRKKNYIEF